MGGYGVIDASFDFVLNSTIPSTANCAAGASSAEMAPWAGRPVDGSAFDKLARPYRWLEYLAFGRALEGCRLDLLPWLGEARRVLTFGEGDGRLVAALVRRWPGVRVDCVEGSAAMIEQARARLPQGEAGARVNFIQADALGHELPVAGYDTVVTCFFLDCFPREDLAGWMPRVAAALRPGGQWLVAEFRQPAGGWAAWRARVWLRAMYFFFRHATALRARELPDWEAEMAVQGGQCAAWADRNAGFMRASRWIFPQKNSQNSPK